MSPTITVYLLNVYVHETKDLVFLKPKPPHLIGLLFQTKKSKLITIRRRVLSQDQGHIVMTKRESSTKMKKKEEIKNKQFKLIF